MYPIDYLLDEIGELTVSELEHSGLIQHSAETSARNALTDAKEASAAAQQILRSTGGKRVNGTVQVRSSLNDVGISITAIRGDLARLDRTGRRDAEARNTINRTLSDRTSRIVQQTRTFRTRTAELKRNLGSL